MRHRTWMFLAALLTTTTAGAAGNPAELVPAIVTYHRLPAGIAGELNLLRVPEGMIRSGAVIPSIDSVSLTAPRALLELLAQDPRVRTIRPQRKLKLNLYGSVAQINARGVDVPETVGPAGCAVERPGVTGAGVKVAVIDSGVHATHPALLGRVLEGFNFEGSLIDRELGVLSVEEADAYAEAQGPTALVDEVGHGTHCAGTVGGDGAGSAGLDQRGVAPGVEMVSMKIASAANGVVVDAGFEANSVRAIDYLVRHKDTLGVRIASNSWGLLEEEEQAPITGPTDFDPIQAAVRAAVEAGIVMVFAAGNDGPDPDTVRAFPSSMEEVITVGSSCKADHGSCPAGQVNSFSSRGPSVDVTAPGDQILAAMSPNSVLAPLGQTVEGDYFGDSPADEAQNRAFYMRLSGTSMATPHVAGVVALLLEANPDLTPAEVRQILIDTADDMVVDGDPELLPGFDNASGYGQVNVRRALAAAVGAPPPDALCPTSVPGAPVVPPGGSSETGGGRFGGGGLGAGLLLGLALCGGLRRRFRS